MRRALVAMLLLACGEDHEEQVKCVELDPSYPCDVFKYCQVEAFYYDGRVDVLSAFYVYDGERAYCADTSCDGAFYIVSNRACNPEGWYAGPEDSGA